MALDVPNRSLRSMEELSALLDAVHRATDDDETAAVEWKGPLDLSSSHGRVHVARAVLGIANRDPADAAGEFGGLGYVIVGLGPGDARGVASVDPADLSRGIAVYMGEADEAPRYMPTFVPFGDVRVLVVLVEAPEPGQPIFLFRKEATVDVNGKQKTYRDGSVFVRSPGRTDHATSRQMDRLQRRLLERGQPPASLRVELDAVVLPRLDLHPDVVGDEYVERVRNQLLDAARRRSERPATSWMGAGVLDTRSLAEFEGEVSDWAASAGSDAADAMLALLAGSGVGMFTLSLVNESDHAATNAGLELLLPDEVVAVDPDLVDVEDLASPPVALGERDSLADFISMPVPHVPTLDLPRAPTYVDADGRVVFEAGTLRPRESRRTDRILAVVVGDGPSKLTVGWRARTESDPGVVRGEVTFDVGSETFSTAKLLSILIGADKADPRHG